MLQELPDTAEEAQKSGKDYPHTKEKITKKVLTSKLKAICIKFREAVDSGCRSGHGHVVLLYYELCEKIWGGSPATEEIYTGLESSEILSDEGQSEDQIPPTDTDELDTDVLTGEPDVSDSCPNDPGDSSGRNSGDTVSKKREFLDKKLVTHRHERMKRKLPIDSQLLACALQELALKKKMVQQMDNFEKQYCETMTKISSNMDKIANSISDGFSVLRNLMTHPQPPNPYYHQSHHQYHYPSPSINYPSPPTFSQSDSQ